MIRALPTVVCRKPVGCEAAEKIESTSFCRSVGYPLWAKKFGHLASQFSNALQANHNEPRWVPERIRFARWLSSKTVKTPHEKFFQCCHFVTLSGYKTKTHNLFWSVGQSATIFLPTFFLFRRLGQAETFREICFLSCGQSAKRPFRITFVNFGSASWPSQVLKKLFDEPTTVADDRTKSSYTWYCQRAFVYFIRPLSTTITKHRMTTGPVWTYHFPKAIWLRQRRSLLIDE